MGAVLIEDLIDINPFEKENKPVPFETTLDMLMNMGIEEKPQEVEIVK